MTLLSDRLSDFAAYVYHGALDAYEAAFPKTIGPAPEGYVYAKDLQKGMCVIAYDWILDQSMPISDEDRAWVRDVKVTWDLYRTPILKLYKRYPSEVIVTLTDGRTIDCDPEEEVELYQCNAKAKAPRDICRYHGGWHDEMEGFDGYHTIDTPYGKGIVPDA